MNFEKRLFHAFGIGSLSMALFVNLTLFFCIVVFDSVKFVEPNKLILYPEFAISVFGIAYFGYIVKNKFYGIRR